DDSRSDQSAQHRAGAREPTLFAQHHRVAQAVDQGRQAELGFQRRDHQSHVRDARRRGEGRPEMTNELEIGLYIFMLAGFLGYHLITRVPPLLHTPLMSATNAIAAISLVGSLVVAGADSGKLSTILGVVAVTFSTINIVGGFLITDRM